jgi:hypothetical protein
MEAQIRVSGGDEIEEIAGLWEWLRGERGLAGAVQAVRRPPGPEEMGGAFDMLAVAVGSGGAATVLARALITWLQTRRPNVSVTVTTTARTVTIQASDLDADAAKNAVLPLLRQALGDGDG